VLTYQEFNEWVPDNSSGKISKGRKVGGIEIPDKSSGKLPHEFVLEDGRWMGYLFKKKSKKDWSIFGGLEYYTYICCYMFNLIHWIMEMTREQMTEVLRDELRMLVNSRIEEVVDDVLTNEVRDEVIDRVSTDVDDDFIDLIYEKWGSVTETSEKYEEIKFLFIDNIVESLMKKFEE